MIPKVIHYCWFGGNPLPASAKKCIASWRKYLPDYEIKEWNESNFDYKALKYTREAYAVEKYAFVSDVARLYALYNYGGIYFDTDIKVLKNFDDLLCNKSFLGYEVDNVLGTGVIGTEKGVGWVRDFYNLYESVSFITRYGNLDLLPNTLRLKKLPIFSDFELNNQEAIIQHQIHVYPFEFFCAKDFKTQKIKVTKVTYSIHDYAGSWLHAKKQTIHMRLKNICIKYFGCN